MKIELKEILIKDVVAGYIDSAEEGVVAYDGKLNVRPAYQREFVYKDNKRDEVIKTIKNGFPLNVMYWVKNEDGTFEVLDGQQRTISFCQYCNGEFSLDYQYFHNLTKEEQDEILNYKLMVYFCEGTNKEKLDWFKIINIAGEKLTDQELRNAIYTGEWLTEAKKYFSKTSCPAYQIAEKYMTGSPIRQHYLETALKWIANRDKCEIEEYMAKHQHDTDANDLWLYFQNVISWVKTVFVDYDKKMAGIDWGILYNKYKDNTYKSKDISVRVAELKDDDEVGNLKGIYEFILSNETRIELLSLRQFPEKMAKRVYEYQKHICPHCAKVGENKEYQFEEMEADHIIPWSKGGKTEESNCQMLCKHHNRVKSGS